MFISAIFLAILSTIIVFLIMMVFKLSNRVKKLKKTIHSLEGSREQEEGRELM